jgi:hypothetical protein
MSVRLSVHMGELGSQCKNFREILHLKFFFSEIFREISILIKIGHQ